MSEKQKTIDGFDGFMNKAEKVSRYAFPFLAASLTAGCTPEMINALAKTVETPEVSPLPSDLTKTPTLSPTEANYELTPIVVNPATQELTLVSPTEVATEIPTEMPTLTLTPEPTATLIPEPTATVTPESTATLNPEIEIVDEELAERIKSLMPAMWFYNDVSKSFEVRNPDEFTFMISKRTRLLISDKEGNEVGFARYFVKNSPDAQMTEYYSLTDKSTETLIPLKLYSQMGEYSAQSITLKGVNTTKQCMFGFVEEYTEFKTNTIFPQEVVDKTQEYAPDSRNIQKGEKMLETAVLRALANITNESEDKLFEDFQNGVSVELETNKGKWVVNRGINYIWSDTQSRSYEILNGELFLFNGFSGSDLADDATEGCSPMAWDIGFRTFWGDNFSDYFPDAVEIYKFNSLPSIDRETIQIPVVFDLRKD